MLVPSWVPVARFVGFGWFSARDDGCWQPHSAEISMAKSAPKPRPFITRIWTPIPESKVDRQVPKRKAVDCAVELFCDQQCWASQRKMDS